MKKIYILLFLGAFVSSAYAQGELSTFEAWFPKFIEENNGAPVGIAKGQTWQEWCEAKIINEGLGEDTKKAWIVYSDRENNPTYQDASCSQPTGKKLKFGDKLYVAKVQGGAAYVFKTNRNVNYPKIKNADFLGWVPISNLLLWETCPKSKNQIYRKALVVYNPSEDKSTEGPINKDPKFFLAPSDDANVGLADAKSLDILFIMKKVQNGPNTYYLLSNQYNCRDIGSSLYGWLPSSYITEWDQRLAIEPSSDAAVVRKYKAANLKPAAYSRIEEAQRYFNNSTMGRPLYTYDKFSTVRMDPLIMRQPILDSTINHYIYKVAVTTSIEGSDKGGGMGYQERKADVQRKIDALTRMQQHINIIFVIDATNSMKEFYPAISNALKDIKGYEFFSDPKTKSLIKIGVVLYRDSKREPEYFPLNHDIDKLVSFLNDVKTSPDGKDDRVALFNGIETALDCKKMGYNSEHSNYLILLGDAGNNQKDNLGTHWSELCGKLALKLADNKINFLAYQISNKGSNADADYINQVKKMQRDLTAKYVEVTGTQMDYKRVSQSVSKLVRLSTGEDDLPIYSMSEYAEPGETKSASVITKAIVSHAQTFYNIISERITKYNRLAEGGYRVSSDAEEDAIREELRLSGWDNAKIESTIRFMKQGGVAKFTTFAPVMTKTELASTQYPIYNYVLFFSQDELTDLIRDLEKLNNIRGDERKAYQEAVISMGRAMLGDFSQAQINSMDINELMGQIYGVPVNISTLGFKIDEITEKPVEEVKEYIVDFRRKLDDLKSAVDNGEGRFEKNGTFYYWISTDVMPGFKLTVY